MELKDQLSEYENEFLKIEKAVDKMKTLIREMQKIAVSRKNT